MQPQRPCFAHLEKVFSRFPQTQRDLALNALRSFQQGESSLDVITTVFGSFLPSPLVDVIRLFSQFEPTKLNEKVRISKFCTGTFALQPHTPSPTQEAALNSGLALLINHLRQLAVSTRASSAPGTALPPPASDMPAPPLPPAVMNPSLRVPPALSDSAVHHHPSSLPAASPAPPPALSPVPTAPAASLAVPAAAPPDIHVPLPPAAAPPSSAKKMSASLHVQ